MKKIQPNTLNKNLLSSYYIVKENVYRGIDEENSLTELKGNPFISAVRLKNLY